MRDGRGNGDPDRGRITREAASEVRIGHHEWAEPAPDRTARIVLAIVFVFNTRGIVGSAAVGGRIVNATSQVINAATFPELNEFAKVIGVASVATAPEDRRVVGLGRDGSPGAGVAFIIRPNASRSRAILESGVTDGKIETAFADVYPPATVIAHEI
jgi:hypothetical protein